MAKYLISFPSAAMNVPDSEWKAASPPCPPTSACNSNSWKNAASHPACSSSAIAFSNTLRDTHQSSGPGAYKLLKNAHHGASKGAKRHEALYSGVQL